MSSDIFTPAQNILYTTCFARHDAKDYWPILSSVEQKLAKQKVNPFLQDQAILSYGLRRLKLAALLDADPQQLIFDQIANNKPILFKTPIHFNVAHSDEHWVLLINPDQAIGVDIESMHRTVDYQALAKRFFSPSEVEWLNHTADSRTLFWQLWTAKEALLKASGAGLADLERCIVHPDEAGHLQTQAQHYQTWEIKQLIIDEDALLTAAIPRGQSLQHCVF